MRTFTNNACSRIRLIIVDIPTKEEGRSTVINTQLLPLQCAKKRAGRIKQAQFHASPSIHFVDLTRTQWCKDKVNRRAGVQPRFYLGLILLHELNYFPSSALPNLYWPHLLRDSHNYGSILSPVDETAV